MDCQMIESVSRPATPARAHLIGLAAVTTVAAAAVGALQPSLVAGVLRAVLVIVLVPCALIDLRRRIIPNRITGPGALVALVLGTALDPSGEPHRLLWAGVCGGFLLVAALAYPAGMGMGDVKLITVMGLLLGPAVLVALMLALLAQIAAGIVLAARHGLTRARKTALPFGPFLAGGGVAAALAGDALLRTYLSLHR
jgi:leader peptidase (prepilin peptidase)/N-methyltransferase